LVGLLLLVFFIWTVWGGERLGDETWLLFKGFVLLALMVGGLMMVIFGVVEWLQNRRQRAGTTEAPPTTPDTGASPAPGPQPAVDSAAPVSAEAGPPEDRATPASEEAGPTDDRATPASEEDKPADDSAAPASEEAA
jgi:cytoskeletal protein RodZ